MSNAISLKKSLLSAGFEVYRTLEGQIQLADRVRDNLIMDSGVAVATEPLAVRVVFRAQRAEFPGLTDQQLYERAVGLAEEPSSRGYMEIERRTVRVRDPGDKSKTLDTWFEVVFERNVEAPEALHDELRFALALRKGYESERDS